MLFNCRYKKIDYSMKENPEWPEVFKYQNKALTV